MIWNRLKAGLRQVFRRRGPIYALGMAFLCITGFQNCGGFVASDSIHESSMAPAVDSENNSVKQQGVRYAGVNIGGLEFMNGGRTNLGLSWLNAAMPTGNLYEISYLAGKNGGSLQAEGISATAVRVPFIWERLQQGGLNTAIDWTTPYAKSLTQIVDALNAQGIVALLDCHQYGVYPAAAYDDWPATYSPRTPTKIGGSQVPVSAFADFWGQIAKHYAGNPLVFYGIMNEPGYGGEVSTWASICNAVIAAIRSAGATALISVSMIGSANGAVTDLVSLAGQIVDSGSNWCIEWHQYFDTGNGGSSAILSPVPARLSQTQAGLSVPVGYGAILVENVINAARAKKFRLWFGEFGFNSDDDLNQPNTNQYLASGPNPSPQLGLQIGQYFGQYLNDNSDIVIGMSYWDMGGQSNGYVYGADPGFLNNTVHTEMHQIDGSPVAGTAGLKAFWKGGSATTTSPVAIPVFPIYWRKSPMFGAMGSANGLTSGYGDAGGDPSMIGIAGFINPLDEWTVEAWVSNTAAKTTNAYFAGMYNFFGLGMDTKGNAFAGVGYGWPNQKITTTKSLVDGVLHHVRLTVTGNKIATLYVDGQSLGTTTIPHFEAANILGIGSIQGGANPWGGTVSSVTLWATVLNTGAFTPPSPLSLNMSEGQPFLIGYWPLNGDSSGYLIGGK